MEVPESPRGGARPELEARLEALEERNRDLLQRLQDLERRLQMVVNPPTAVRLTGYIDAGFFVFFRGNGSGITNYIAQPRVMGSDARSRYESFRNDPVVQRFPEFFAPCGFDDAAFQVVPCPRAPAGPGQARWRFLGDPLATAINSQGHPADVRAQNNPAQSSLAVPYDFIQSGGRPTFLINEVLLQPIAKLGETLQAVAAISLYPRTASLSIGDKQDGGSVVPAGPMRLGDYLGVSLAFLEWAPSWTGPGGRHQVSVFAGRFDGNVGIEYRVRQSPDRFGITPSLICRYSCGTPIGLKVRGRFFDDWLHVHLGVHNSPSYQEIFRFSEQTDKKYMKTISGRLAVHAPWLGGVEVGVSGEYGGQVDGFYDVGRAEFDPFVAQWTVDVDLHLEYRGLELRAEFLRTQADGFIGSADRPALPRLVAQGAYVELSYRLLNWLGLMGRWDFRDAVHIDYAVPFAYNTLLWRLTAGARLDINSNIAFKAEFLHLQPFGRMAEALDDNTIFQMMAGQMGQLAAGDFAADYLTTSLVLRY
ncbi:MAG: bZIP transcription factor [Myxococcales bacterium]|nr:bZIP transcription factor [Myxococcales bacterium]